MNEMKQKLDQIIAELREVVDLSVKLRSESPEAKKQVAMLWQEFLAQFIGYIREKSISVGENLLVGVAFPKWHR